ncbi:MAG TPA: PAS domain S-box protein, partial [Rheinheimera sp.]|nr:PAS domain S-box protein [Rheinheimera sp.]
YSPDKTIQIANPDALLHFMVLGSDIVQTSKLSEKPFQGIFSPHIESCYSFFACSAIHSDIGRFLGCFGILGERTKLLLPDEKVFFQWVAENLALDIAGNTEKGNDNLKTLTDLRSVIVPYLDDIYFLVDTSAVIVVMPKQLPDSYKRFVQGRCGTLASMFGEELSKQFIELMHLTEMTQRKQTMVFQQRFHKIDYQFAVACNSMNEDWYLLTFHDVTERNRLREQLEDRKRMLENILQAGSIGVVLMQDDFRITFSNDTAQDWLELAPASDESYLPAVHQKVNHESTVVDSPFVSLFAEQKTLSDIRYRYKQKKGATKTFTVNAVYSPAHGDGPAMGTFYLIDVTERARLEQAMVDMDEQMQFLLQSSPVVIYQMLPGTSLDLVYASPNIGNIVGCTQQDVVNKAGGWSDRVHPDDLERVVMSVDETERASEYRIWFDKRQAYRWIKDIRRQISDDVKDGFIGAFLDITERKEAELKQLALQRDIQSTLAAVVDAVITFDNTGIMVSFNPATCRLFGYGADELAGQSIAMLMPLSMTESHNQYIGNYLHNDKPQDIDIGRELIAKHKDGHEFPVALSIAPLSLAGGKQRFVGCCHDLSLIKKQQEQLLQSERLSAVGRLTSSIAHDFNNILGIVRGYAEMLLSNDDKVAAYARHIVDASDRATEMISQLLDFSSSKRRKVTTIEINQYLHKMRPLLIKAVGPDIELQYELSDKPLAFEVELTGLDNALLNMAVNAKHAMHGKGSFTIATVLCSGTELPAELQGNSERYVCLSITDTGQGMTDEVKQRLFEPFFTTKGDNGTGLGLAQTFGLVKRCQGAIEVISELGGGSRFKLFFPHIHAEIAHDDEPLNQPAPALLQDKILSSSRSVITSETESKKNRTILVVDDEAELLEMLATLLESSGFNILKATDATTAIK